MQRSCHTVGGMYPKESLFDATGGDMNRFYRFGFASLALALAILLLPAAGNNAFAQVSSGSLSGTVLDPQGASVPGAVVKLVSKETNRESTATSDNTGLFRLSLLSPGVYRMEITKSGFRKTVVNNVEVTVGADNSLGGIKLEIGEVSSTIEVTAAPPLLEATQAQITNSITAEQIGTFPGVLENQGLDFLALFVPGVVNNRDLGFSNTNGTGFAVNGIRGRNNDQQIDGQNNNDNSVAGPGLFLSNPEFVQEYQITTSNFGAEYGRNSGSAVNILTKSGSNDVHGSIFGTESNSALNALSNTQRNSVFGEGLTKPARFNDEFTGATIGGPFWKDKVFYFGGFDNEIVSQRQVFSTGLLTPTPNGIATLAACFPGSASIQALQRFGPYGVGGGNPTPQGVRPLTDPNSNTNGCAGVELGGVQRTLPTGSHTYDWIYKLDVRSAKNSFYGRYIYNKSTFFNTDAFGTAASGYPANVPAFSQVYGGSWTRTLTSRMANEFRASYGRLTVEFGGNSIGNTVPLQGNIAQALAQVSFSNSALLAFGPATNAPQGRIVNSYQGQDNWTYFVGRHGLKAGVNFTYQRSPNIFLPNVNGQFRFSNWGTFAQNVPNRIRIASGNPSLDFREKDTFLYFGDDFKVKSHLTLNLGITWSYYGQPANLFHDITTKRESNAATAFWNPALPLSVRTFPLIPAPKNSWGPSVGFAYSPQWGGFLTGHGKTVLRGGFRLSYDPAYYNIYVNISSATPEVLLNTLTGASATGNPLLAVPTGPNVRTQLASSLTLGVFDPRTFNETSITPNFSPQRTPEWSFGLQREVTKKAVFEARYVGNHGTRLFQSVNGNPRIDGLAAAFPNLVPAGETPCSAANAAVPQAIGRVNCNAGIVRTRTNTGYSDYNSVQFEFRANQLFNQLNLKTGYTFSKTTDNASEIFGTGAAGGTSAFAQSQVNATSAEHGLSGLDFPHNFFVSFYEDLPAFRAQHGVIGHILGGWGFSGTYALVSGQTYTPIQSALNCFSIPQAIGCLTPPSLTNPVGLNLNASSFYDLPFTNAFIGLDQASRPFLGNPSAPATAVGIFAADACNNFGVGCALSATTLLSLNAINLGAANQETPITNNDVRFIVNGIEANQVFGTPFGNVARNFSRDARTNIANVTFFKTVKAWERAKVTFHMSMLNAFNHPNFSSVDPFIDDAGLAQEGTGFANPRLTSGGIQTATGTPGRSIRFGLRIGF